ncbi:ATP-dependent metallopeptidase HflB/ftsH family protein [Babesia bovis T2Bo]|uniref:Cell division protein metalloprotease FtsH, putative n=1 Tax=Babesia bovis TaxID=5865 RepID=A7ASM0_BABBO|nr:ATP-dependent metallopeptidase HflB/ftsH family protein [Babesia bovis T2Bo]EDO07539.1 ATP-dependent metallopeptidase HflB/ftsH family protein [Babesia bovis T2Bo]|eukprot:XP_001611107.1 cell division protein metalloprotease FtsH [Babesia bovis T2Bo]
MDPANTRRPPLGGAQYSNASYDEQDYAYEYDNDSSAITRPFFGKHAGFAQMPYSHDRNGETPMTDPGSTTSFAANISSGLANKWNMFRSSIYKSLPPETPSVITGPSPMAQNMSKSAWSFNVPSVMSYFMTSVYNSCVTLLSAGMWLLLQVLGIAAGVVLTGLILTALGSFLVPKDNDFGNVTPKNKPATRDDRTQQTAPPPERPPVMLERVYFKDIMGIDEAKEELMEVVKFIKQPKLYHDIGAKIPKGVLLVGPPGTGKTMLAKAVATEANIPFIYTSGPEFVEIFVGQGAQRVRNLFAKARKQAPCIVFIDEIDAIGAKRASGSLGGQNREHDQTLNQLLVEMDGFNLSTGITVLAATNRMEALDRALLRPGRFDRVVHIPLPSLDGREAILKRYLSGIKYDKDNVDVRALAKLTPGYSGADLKNLVNEAALNCVRSGRTQVSTTDLQEARDKVGMGSIRRTTQPELQRKMTAYHEAGHALVAFHLYPDADPVHKATIIHRGSALGFVEQLPEDDRQSYKLAQMKARLAICMGGRIAEELVFGKENVTSGASSDIVAASELAYRMVTEWGMSPKLGPVNLRRIGGIQTPHGTRKLSHDTAQTVEQEVERLVSEAHFRAASILRRHRNQLERIAERLLEEETLTGEQIRQIIAETR